MDLAWRRWTWVLSLAASLTTPGCWNSDGLIAVQGTVKFEGEPVEEGLIHFAAVSKDGPTAEAVIKDGAYAVKVAPGEKTVKIRGFKTVGHEHAVKGNPDSPLLPIRKDIVPAKYNEKSELTRTITSESRIEDFDLTGT